MLEAQKTLEANLKEIAFDLETKSDKSLEREKLNDEIKSLRGKAVQIKNSDSSSGEIEEINKQIEALLNRITNM